MDTFDRFTTMTFYLRVLVPQLDGNGKFIGNKQLRCPDGSNRCTITYQKQYTPLIYYIQPPVVYKGAYAEIHFTPRNTMNLINDLLDDERPFINAKIAGANMEFEGFVSYGSSWGSYYQRSMTRGLVTD